MSVLVPELQKYHHAGGSPHLSKTKPSGILCSSQHLAASEITVNGGDVGDIPATFHVPSPKAHELITVGNYVHKYVLPGFKYKVRINGTDDYLFRGKSMYLESVGQGYGKRLTFESQDILCNDNMFWSDSSETGYAFSVDVLQTGDIYYSEGLTYLITNVDESQEVIRTSIEGLSCVMEVAVSFHCQRLEDSKSSELNNHYMSGTVTLSKENGRKRSKIVSFSASARNGQVFSLRKAS